MPRSIQITVPSSDSGPLAADLQQLEGLVGLQLQPHASLKPPGDVLTATLTTSALQEFMQVLDRHGIGQRSGTSFTSSEPISLVASSHAKHLSEDSHEASWEEMEIVSAEESSMSQNMMAMMLLSGFLAGIGIGTNALHLVIGAMVLAPGFIPFVRISLGLVHGSKALSRGLQDVFKGYGALAIGAALATAYFLAKGENPLTGEASYLPKAVLSSYWTNITVASLLASAAASIAGTILISTNRSILSGGVMIALALVPSFTLIIMAGLTGETNTALQAVQRFLIDVGLVVGLSTLVLTLKRSLVHKRKLIL
jgi:hypothetical protein